MNSLTLVAVLTKDPELVGSEERPICRMRLAEANSRPGHPLYISASVFGDQAAASARDLHRGSRVAVVGRLRFREWKRVDLSRRSEHWIAVEEISTVTLTGHGDTVTEEVPAPVEVMR